MGLLVLAGTLVVALLASAHMNTLQWHACRAPLAAAQQQHHQASLAVRPVLESLAFREELTLAQRTGVFLEEVRKCGRSMRKNVGFRVFEGASRARAHRVVEGVLVMDLKCFGTLAVVRQLIHVEQARHLRYRQRRITVTTRH